MMSPMMSPTFHFLPEFRTGSLVGHRHGLHVVFPEQSQTYRWVCDTRIQTERQSYSELMLRHGPKPHHHFELAQRTPSTGAEAFRAPRRPSFHGPKIGFVALRVTLFWPWSNPAPGQASGNLAQIGTTVSGLLLMLRAPWSNLRISDSSIAPHNCSQAQAHNAVQNSQFQQVLRNSGKLNMTEKRRAACCYCAFHCFKRKASVLA